MSAKKNKSKKKPAMGSPVAGSNNKRDKNVKTGKNNNQQQRPVQSKKPGAEHQKPKPQADADVRKGTGKSNNPASNKKEAIHNNKNISSKPKKKKSSFKRFAQKYNIGKIVIAALLAIGIISFAVYLVISLFTPKVTIPDDIKNAEYKGRLEPSTVAVQMKDISSQQQKKLADAVKVKGDKSAFSFFVNDKIILDDYKDPALIEFGSVDTNKCVLLAFLIDENGRQVYRSLGVEPGKQISSVTLFDEVPYGNHKMTFIVNGYDPDTKEKIGTQTTEINLTIGS